MNNFGTATFLKCFFPPHATTDAATELQVSNSKLAEVESAFGAQKSEVSLFTLQYYKPFWPLS